MTGRLSKRLAKIEAAAQAREKERRRDEIDGALLAVFRNLWALMAMTMCRLWPRLTRRFRPMRPRLDPCDSAS